LLSICPVAAFLLGGGTPSAFADTCAVNDVGITTGSVTNTGTINCINIQNSTVNGNVTNAAGGAINATGSFGSPTDTGIVINNNSSVSGSVSNAGTINASLAGINVFAPVLGGIVNSGNISALAGIGVDASTFSGGISNSGTITTGGDAIVVGLVSTFSGGISNTGTISSGAEGIFVISDTTYSGGIRNSGTVSAINDGIIVIGVSTYSGGIVNFGTIISSDFGVSVGGGGHVSSFSGGIANSGTITANSNGISVAFLSAFSGGISNSGTISAGSSNGIAVGSVSTFDGNISNSGTITATTGIFIGSDVTFTAGSAIVNSGTIISTGGTAIDVRFATSPVTIAQTSGLIAGDIKLSAGADVLNISGGTINGNIVGAGASNAINFALGSGIFTYNSAFTGIHQVNINSGIVVLSGANVATNIDVNGGALIVDGSTASSSLTTVNPGGALAGSGTVGNTAIVGGTLAPGSIGGSIFGPLTVQGSLSFTVASAYLIEVSPANAARTNVTGSATLGGATVSAMFQSGSYINKQYTIVNATGGVSGTFNPTVLSNMAANIQSTLSYDANDAFLNIKLLFAVPPSGSLNGNQQNVANALTGFFNSNGGIPFAFAALNPAGLSIASGELPTASQRTTFDAMNLFLGLLIDPFVAGRGNGLTSMPGTASRFAEEGDASAYASTGRKRAGSEREAYGMITKAAPREVLDPSWSVWAAGFGGSQTTDGNAVLGSNTATSRVFGTAVGADFLLSPRTIAGFALAGGGTNFSVANGLGSGRSDLFQAGAFVRHTAGSAYVSGALAYGWQDITTDRTVTLAGIDQLRGRFNANTWSGRVESGYRFVAPVIGGVGVMPYAAGQFTTFDLPSYAEQTVIGANTFALAYASKTVTDTRSELGIRADKSFAMQNAILTLRGRAAWAHDYNPDRSIGATFQTLPGASFVVNGARQATDAALTTASVEMKWMNGWSAAGTFEGEFSDATRSYAGKGVVRYQW
jgi:uncharacterized protein with beta-barrel porin domain